MLCSLLLTSTLDLHLSHMLNRPALHVQKIMVAGKPHLGTDRLIKILQAFRKHLTALGVQIHFGSCVTDLQLQHDRVAGVKLKGTCIPSSDAHHTLQQDCT